MKLKLSYLLLPGVLLLGACQDFLDVKPVGKLIPKDVEEFENLLNNTNTMDYLFMDNNRGCLLAMLGDNMEISENVANYQYTASYVNVPCYAAYAFNQPYENPQNASYYWESSIYEPAGIFNNVIEGVNNVRTPASAMLADQLVAQAKVGRAWCYLVGSMVFGPVYDPAGANDAKTITYRESADPTAPNPPLSTTAEVFSKVKADLEDALEHLPTNVGNPTRANLAAGQALMAYYYMFTRDFGKMYEYADMAWSSAVSAAGGEQNMFYDYNKCYYEENPSASPSPGTDVEISLDFKGQDDNIGKSYGLENLFYRITPSEGTYSTGYPSEEFLALFDQDKDMRYRFFALKGLGYKVVNQGTTYDDGIRVMYYRTKKVNMSEGITFPELILMRAEAAARTSNLTQALSDLNTLRKYRYDNTQGSTDLPNGSALNQDQLLEEVLKERRREMPLGSFQRMLDLKRLSLDTGKPWSKTTIVHKVGSKEYSADVDSKYFILPIPNNIIKYNPQWGLQLDTRPYNPKGV